MSREVESDTNGDDLSMGWKLTNVILSIMATVIFARQSFMISSITDVKQSNAVLTERINNVIALSSDHYEKHERRHDHDLK